MIPGIREIGFGPGSERPYATLHEATAAFAVMGERTITTQVRIDGDVIPDFEGWELEFKGERFVLPVKEPQAQKNNTTRNSLVDLTFYSWPIYQMKRYFFFETTTTATGTVMADKYQASVNLNLVNFVELFNRVLDYYFDGKIVADLATGSYGTAVSAIQLDYSYIWDVLQDFYSIFNVRWTIAYDEEEDVYTIKIGYTPDVIEEHEFEYGFQGGLLHFERQLQDDNIKNILLGRGGEKNLPYRYFKKTDPNNTEWAADPDAVPELANIYFDRLRDQNFRNYIQGWKTNPNRLLDTGDVVETYDERRGAYDWAYKKGHEDELFDPVEYVKDQESIEKYGERWGALDDNDDIFPTIQGIIRPGMGRVDEVVGVSPITTDDIEAASDAAAEIVSLNGVMNQTHTINAYSYYVSQIRGTSFEVPTGQVANLRDPVFFATNTTIPELDPLVFVVTDLSQVRIYRSSDDEEVPAKGLTAGSYYWVIDITTQNNSSDNLVVTYGVNGLELEISDPSSETWKPTFDIWIKNIFESAQQPEETDEEYALRVWQEILGDRLGNEAKVVFSDGFMSISEDYEFVIATYPVVDRSKTTLDGYRSEWKLTLYKCAAEYEVSGLYIPNNTSGGKPVAGDHFFFVGIDMPHMYVALAEERLTQYKTLALEQMSEVNPTWVINIDKVRADMVNADQQRLFDQISPGVEMHVKDRRFTRDEILRLFANTITYTWREPTDDNPYLLPDVEIVVSDRIVVEKTTVEKMQGDLDVLKATYAKMSDMESVIQQVASPMFLRKTGEQDTSLSPTRFASTVTSRDFRQGGFGGRGWGLYRDNSNKYQNNEATVEEATPSRGRRLAKAAPLRDASPTLEEKATDAVLEIDKLVVRKEMQVNSLVVNQIAYIGGKQINSAAAMECVQVVETDDSYICYFDQKQGSVKNLFTVGDIAMGQVFDPNNMTLRYYKMIVTATDVDCITLSKAGRAGSSAPMKGDVIVQYGNLYDESRQYVIIRDVIGGGYERMLSDLNSVDATGTEYYFAGCDMSSDGVPTALFSSDPEPLYDSNDVPLMSTEYARARFFVGGDDSHMEFKQADRRLYLLGTFVQSQGGDSFPVVCYRGDYDTTGQTLYYYGDEVSHQGGTYVYYNPIPSNTAPPNPSYWKERAKPGVSAKSVEIMASSLFFTYDKPESPTPTGDQTIVLTCVTQNITGPTYQWSFWDTSGATPGWTPIAGQAGTARTLSLPYNSAWFNGGKIAKVKVEVSGDANLYDEISIYKVTGGKDGESILIVDLDNEMEGIELTSTGRVKSTTVLRTTAMIHYGAEAQVITGATASGLPSGCSYTVSLNAAETEATFAITFPANTALDASQNIGIHLTSAKGSGVVSFAVLGLREGTPIYSIVPSVRVISRDRDNHCDPTGVTCQVMKQTADGYVDGLADGTLKYYLDSSTTGQIYTAGQTILVGDGSGKFHDKVRFEFTVNGTVLDKETINVVDDGEESISVFLTNTAKNFAAGDRYAVPDSDSFNVIVFRGTTKLEYDGEDFVIGTIYNKDAGSQVSPRIPTGMTVSVDDDPESETFGTITVAVDGTFETQKGILIVPVTVSGYGTVYLEYNWALALTGRGQKGDPGPSLRGPTTWDETKDYYAGRSVASDGFQDIVYYSRNGMYYLCVADVPTATESNPNLDPETDSRLAQPHWKEFSRAEYVASDFSLALKSKIVDLNVRRLTTENEQDPKAVVNIENDKMAVKNSSGEEKVVITSGSLGSGDDTSGNYNISYASRVQNIDCSGTDYSSGEEEYVLGSITIPNSRSNNLVTIPQATLTLEYTSNNPGNIYVEYRLTYGTRNIFSGSLSTGYGVSDGEITIPSSKVVLPTNNGNAQEIKMYIRYEVWGDGAISGRFDCRFQSTSQINIAYPAVFTAIATDGAQFRYGTDGIRISGNSAQVIQDGQTFNMAGLGALNGLTAPKRIVFCTQYPSPEDPNVFYIKVQQTS